MFRNSLTVRKEEIVKPRRRTEHTYCKRSRLRDAQEHLRQLASAFASPVNVLDVFARHLVYYID